jgi:hypothetical protein
MAANDAKSKPAFAQALAGLLAQKIIQLINWFEIATPADFSAHCLCTPYYAPKQGIQP